MWLVPAYIPVWMLLHPISASGALLSCFKRDPSFCVVGKKHSDWKGLLMSTDLCARRSNKECSATDAYNGTKSITDKGLVCDKWNEVVPWTGSTETHNYCRNPESRKMPYCYVKNAAGRYKPRTCFEKCAINYYEECGYGASIQNTVIPVPDLYKCTYMLGSSYYGQELSPQVKGNPEDCCQKCRTVNACIGYTWFNGNCILYRTINNLFHTPAAISGEACKDNRVQDFRRQKQIDKSGDCTYLPGIEIEDSTGDTIFGTPSTSSVEYCCDTCIQSSSCLGYTWTNGMCHLKSSLNQYKRTTGNVYISGEVCMKRPTSTSIAAPETHTNHDPSSKTYQSASAADTSSTNSSATEEGDPSDKSFTFYMIALIVGLILLIVCCCLLYLNRRNKRNTGSKSGTSRKKSRFSFGRDEDDSMTPVNLGRLNHDHDDDSLADGSHFKSEGEKAIQSSSSTTALSPDPEFESQYMVQEITQDDPNREMMTIVKERELYGVEEELEVEPAISRSASSKSNFSHRKGSSSASSSR